MNSNRYKEFRDAFIEDAFELSDAKRIEYCNGNEVHDVHTNFNVIGNRLGLAPMKVLSVYLNKHLESLQSWFRTRKEFSDEPIEQRVKDIINYLLLAMAMKECQDKSDLPEDR